MMKEIDQQVKKSIMWGEHILNFQLRRKWFADSYGLILCAVSNNIQVVLYYETTYRLVRFNTRSLAEKALYQLLSLNDSRLHW